MRRALPAHIRAMLPAEATARPKRAPKQRPAHWPPGVDSELEFMLLTRLERAGLPLGVTQHPVVAGRKFRFDRAYPDQMVGIEIDGGAYSRGRHTRGAGFETDCEKLSLAAAEGWRVLRFTRKHIVSGLAVQLVAKALGVTMDELFTGEGGE